MTDEDRLAELEAKAERLSQAAGIGPPGIPAELADDIEAALLDADSADGYIVVIARARGNNVKMLSSTTTFPTERILDVLRDYLLAVRPQ